MHAVGEPNLAVFDPSDGIHRGLEEPLILHGFADLLHALSGFGLIVDDRWFPDFVCILGCAFACLGEGIRRGSVVEVQLEFPEAQDLGVMRLAEILAQFGRGNLFSALDVDVDFV